MANPVTALVVSQWRLRRVLYASAKAELKKRYAGSLLGPAWAFVYPLLFLSMYLFVWLVVMKMREPGLGRLDYVLFVFSGLVPFLYLMDTLTYSAVVIKQNIQLVKSVIMPIDLIATRTVVVGLASHAVGLALLVGLSVVNGNASWRLAYLPVLLAVQLLWLVGLAWILAPLGVMLPDVAHLIGILSILLMFISPIAFKPEMVPPGYRAVVQLNPVSYMVGAYRWVILGPGDAQRAAPAAAFVVLSLTVFIIGALFCRRFKGLVVDFE
jgi:lipopolysaccharide transport system permease protein